MNLGLQDPSPPLHEPLPLAVSENAALPSRSLGDEASGAIDAGRVELNKLKVLQAVYPYSVSIPGPYSIQTSTPFPFHLKSFVQSDPNFTPHTCSGRPARATMALPSPVQVCAEVAEKYALPYPPVARMVWCALKRCSVPSSMQRARIPRQEPSLSMIRSSAKYSTGSREREGRDAFSEAEV